MVPVASLRSAARPTAASARVSGPRRRTDEIIEAAAEVFASLGYHGASTQDIADRLGMRQASLYYYFPSKEAALEQVCLRGVGDFLERALEAASGQGSAIDKLAEIIRRHLKPGEERPAFVRCFIRERRFLPKDSRRRIGRLARRYEKILQDIIETGVAAGELRRDLDPRLATLALLGMCNATVDWFGKEPGATMARVAENFVRVAIDGVAAKPRTRA